jgi:hypothetical protein
MYVNPDLIRPRIISAVLARLVSSHNWSKCCVALLVLNGFGSNVSMSFVPELSPSVSARHSHERGARASGHQPGPAHSLRDLARDFIKKLKLGELAEFDPVLGGPSRWRSRLSMRGIIKDPMEMTPEERVSRAITIGSRPSRWRNRGLNPTIRFLPPKSPTRSRRCLPRVSAGRQAGADARRQYLACRRDRLRASVAQAEAKVEQYRAKSNLFIGNNNTTLSNQQLGCPRYLAPQFSLLPRSKASWLCRKLAFIVSTS